MSSPEPRARHNTNMDTNRLVVSELTPTVDEHGVSNMQPSSKEGRSITIENLSHVPPRRKPCPSTSQQSLLSRSSLDADHMDYQLSPTQHHDERTNLSIFQCPSTSAPKVHNSDEQASLPKCPARSSIYFGKSNWRTVLNILLSVYSTAFSVLWLVIAIVRPRYGAEIYIGRTYFAPSTASTLFALFAKTIEISSVTVFVTFLGQVLTRRSMHSPGVTVADMAIRTWIVQPGFIFTHWNHFKHVGFTLLGVTSVLATLAILLFTTASDALVSPHLKYTGWEDSTMYSHVRGIFANPDFMERTCKIPGPTTDILKGIVCMTLQDAGLSYTDLNSWLDIWADIEANGVGAPDDLKYRPTAISSIFQNATVKGSWVQSQAYSVPKNYAKFGRVVNNVTLSMPHSGVYSASEQTHEETPSARAIHASMVSPSSNVMCVNMNRSELAPLIYVEWPAAVLLNTTDSPGGTVYIPYQKFPAPGYQNTIQLTGEQEYLNGTVVDDIFQWGSAYGRMPPIFPMWPLDYNSVLNVSVPSSDSIYILFKSASLEDYTVCQMRAFLSPDCSTRQNVTLSDHTIEAHCEDPEDEYTYGRKNNVRGQVLVPYYRNVMSSWALSMSLNTGISNANSTSARLLSQFILDVPERGPVRLSALTPSLAEALSVMSCFMLSKGSVAASAKHLWNYTSLTLDPGIWESFSVSVTSQQYASGPSESWQDFFYLVLSLVFVGNAVCLGYFLIHMGLVMDFTEPQNSFALAINSPFSENLSGSCGGGPQGRQLKLGWKLKKNENNHYYLKEEEAEPLGYKLRRRVGIRMRADGALGKHRSNSAQLL